MVFRRRAIRQPGFCWYTVCDILFTNGQPRNMQYRIFVSSGLLQQDPISGTSIATVNGISETYRFQYKPVVTPEPGTMSLLGTGLVGILWRRYQGKRRKTWILGNLITMRRMNEKSRR
jgi:hypothetical protein